MKAKNDSKDKTLAAADSKTGEELAEQLASILPPSILTPEGWLIDGEMYDRVLSKAGEPGKSYLTMSPVEVAQVAVSLARRTSAKERSEESYLPQAVRLIAESSQLLERTGRALDQRLNPQGCDRPFTVQEAMARLGMAERTLRKWMRAVRPAWTCPTTETNILKWAAENEVPQEWLDWELYRKPCPTSPWISPDLLKDIELAQKKTLRARAAKGHRQKEKNAASNLPPEHRLHA